jgi:TPP-dependent pyruvate/acetoin dehydrogenase alpha subunit
LEKKALTKKEANHIRRKLQKEVNNAADFAVKSDYPEPHEVLDDVFAEVA